MSELSLLENKLIVPLVDKQAAGLGAVDTATVDTAGYDACTFFVKMGTFVATGTATITARQADTPIVGAAITGQSVALTDTDGDEWTALDVRDPLRRYLSCRVDRAVANSEVDTIFAVLYRTNGLLPATQTINTSGPTFRAEDV